MATKKQPEKPDFEAAMQQLETVVEKLEQGDLPLEQALSEWERGMTLQNRCHEILAEAEQKVEAVVEKNGSVEVEPFDQKD